MATGAGNILKECIGLLGPTSTHEREGIAGSSMQAAWKMSSVINRVAGFSYDVVVNSLCTMFYLLFFLLCLAFPVPSLLMPWDYTYQ